MAKAKNKNTKKYDIPAVFSLRRCIENTDAAMDNIRIEQRIYRTVKNYEGSKKENDNKEGSNIAKGEVAIATADTVEVSFDIKFLKLQVNIENCNDIEFYKKFNEKFNTEDNQEVLKKISKYYAFNLINGRWLWRNRAIADGVDIEIKKFRYGEKEPVETVVITDADMFDYDIKLNEKNEIVSNIDKDALDKVSKWIYEEIYCGKPYYLKVKATLYTEKGMQFYPSQLFTDNNKKGEGRVFAKDETGKGIITPQKIGNALRTFDVWYKDYKEIQEPIAIEFMGGSLKFQKNFRGSKDNAFAMLEKWVKDEKMTEEEKLYLVSVFIRGGVFAEAK